MNMNEETKTRCLAETAHALRNADFTVEHQPDGSLSVSFEGAPICAVTTPGGITYRQENLTSPELEQAKDKTFEIVKTALEYMRAFEQGQPLKAAGLTENYKILADFNGTVLAATESYLGMQFVTWDWDFDRSGVSHGHYYGGNYEGAKQDFVTRSNLIAQQRLFTPEQLTEIYRCCADTLCGGFDLSYEQEKTIKGIQEQIEMQMPDIMDHIQQEHHTQKEKAPLLRVLKVEPGKPAYEKEIENSLEAIQEEVGGGIFQTLYMDDGTILCYNDEGKLLGMKMNRRCYDDIICGPFFMVGQDGPDFASLTDEQIDTYMEQFGKPEQFNENEPDAQPRAWIISL